jgi:hypothetical protein
LATYPPFGQTDEEHLYAFSGILPPLITPRDGCWINSAEFSGTRRRHSWVELIDQSLGIFGDCSDPRRRRPGPAGRGRHQPVDSRGHRDRAWIRPTGHDAAMSRIHKIMNRSEKSD